MAILLIKVSGIASYFVSNSVNIEMASSDDNATEKEEKKIESEYFNPYFLSFDHFKTVVQTSKKIVVPNYFNKLNYFPEVLTPPPLV